jgi:hypothetical protein
MINAYLNNGPDVLVGNTEMHVFWFFVDEVGWLVMQYKVFPTNVLWSLKDGPTIRLWKEDGIRWPKLSMGVSNLIPFRRIWGNDELRAYEKEMFINRGISKYIEFWKAGMSKDDLYFKVMGPYVKYWESILELLSRHFPWQSFVLLEGFWPCSNWRTNYECASIPTIVDVDIKDPIIPP